MLGENKAVAHMQVIRARFPDVKVIAHEGYLGDDNKSSLIIEKSIVFGCVDNHFARKLICERGAELNDFAFISAGNEMTDGNVNLYLRKDGKDITPPLWMLHPEISRDKGGDRSAMSCEEIAAMPGGGQVIFTNLMAASLSLAMFWNLSRNPETREILFDINKVKTRSIQI
jgi:molybdopterin/thiamine biosynthesis adenylyltransferase